MSQCQGLFPTGLELKCDIHLLLYHSHVLSCHDSRKQTAGSRWQTADSRQSQSSETLPQPTHNPPPPTTKPPPLPQNSQSWQKMPKVRYPRFILASKKPTQLFLGSKWGNIQFPIQWWTVQGKMPNFVAFVAWRIPFYVPWGLSKLFFCLEKLCRWAGPPREQLVVLRACPP